MGVVRRDGELKRVNRARCGFRIRGGRKAALGLAVGMTMLASCGDDGASTSTAGAGGSGAAGGAGGAGGFDPSTVELHSCGHAHNDYEHDNPLDDALANDFCSVEVDIFLDGTDLLVGHVVGDLDPSRTLTSLYLEPLRSKLASETIPGPDGGPLLLLVDVKTGSEDTYAALDPVLASYADILTSFDAEGVVAMGPVMVVVSGNRAEATMAAQPLRYAALDGRIGNEQAPDASVKPSLVPLVSQKWSLLFDWNGEGSFPTEQRELLDSLVAEAHDAGRLLRFWGTPDEPAVWNVLVEARVDLVNADDLEGLANHLDEFAPPNP